MNNELTHSERVVLFNSLTAVVAGWLGEKGINIYNPEKKQVVICENDLMALLRDFEETLIDYGLIPKEKQKYNVAVHVSIDKIVQVEAVDEDNARDIGESQVRQMLNNVSDVTDIHAWNVQKEKKCLK